VLWQTHNKKAIAVNDLVTVMYCLSCHAGKDRFGLFFTPSDSTKSLVEVAHQITVFAVHTSPPYIRPCRTLDHAEYKHSHAHGWSNYLEDLSTQYAASYTGPFTVGIAWQIPPDQTEDGS